VSLEAVVSRAVEMNRPLIDARRLELEVGADPTLRVHGDQTRLVQVLGNLLNNAAKFSPEGGIVRLSVERHSDAAVVRVRDDGVGLPDDMRERIFEPFVQLERSHRRSGGLGVGLALVRRLVEMHGGAIEARSDGPGTGTEMVVRLPLSSASAVEPSDSRPAPDREIPRRRILVVDDNQDAADTIALSLSSRGHDVQVAYDGTDALARAASFEPDTVLLDLGMPGLDGYTVAGEMRRQPWGRRTYLIALTGWGQLVDRQRTTAAGFDRHLVKPVGDAELVQALGSRRGAQV
jgi:CheY-like chemotaxis protein/anti-sigma regulatory factor (Ser/Thr protein kinase)